MIPAPRAETPLLMFTIVGAPRTKKTSNRIVRCGKFPKVLPSLAFVEWNKVAQLHLLNWKTQMRQYEHLQPFPVTTPVNCRALFYRDALRGDACNYYEAIADALQEAGIVHNDSLITQWDGSRMLLDRKNPRIEVELTAI